MVGVISKRYESQAVEEFFQLFKTPWEFYVPHRSYDFVVATCEDIPSEVNARALAVYDSTPAEDDDIRVVTESRQEYQWLEWNSFQFPVYGDVTVFKSAGRSLVKRKGTGETVGMEDRRSGCQTIRIRI